MQQQGYSSLMVSAWRKTDPLCLPDPCLPQSELHAHILSSLHQSLLPIIVDKLALVKPQHSLGKAPSLCG